MPGYFRQNIVEHIRSNIAAYFFVVLVLVIGVAAGAMAVKVLPDEQKTELAGYLRIFFQNLTGGTDNPIDAAAAFGPVMINHIKTITVIWLLGFTIIGIPFVLFIVFTRGFVIGFTVGFLLDEYVARGLLFALAAVLPHNVLAVPAIIAAGVAAITFSLLLLRRKNRHRANLLYESVGYSLLCFFLLLVLLAAGFIEVYISPVFMKLVASLLLGNG
jgi:stage II sporulation protein M